MTDQIEYTFSTPDGCELDVRNVKGTISVEGWDRSETRVVAHPRVEWARVDIHQEGRQIVARVKDGQGPSGIVGWLGHGRLPAVDFRVRLPFDSDAILCNVNGPIHVSGLRGTVRCNTVDGATTFVDLQGTVKAETVNGRIEATALAGVAKLKTVNGRVEIVESVLQRLDAQAVNGAINFDGALAPEGRFKLSTVNGSCHLRVPTSTSAHVAAHGVNLRVKTDLPTRSVQRSIGNWQGIIGNGEQPAAEISFHTVNGRLKIISRSEEDTVPMDAKASSTASTSEASDKVPSTESALYKAPAGPGATADATPLTKAEVLSKVERGEMTVGQALEFLQKR